MNLQYEASMKLYAMQMDASFAADQFTDLIEQVNARAEALGKGSLFKKLEERAKQLEELKTDLVAPNAGIFVTRERLRDDVVNLYAAVSGYSGKPSKSQMDRMNDLEKALNEFKDKMTPLLDVAGLNRSLERAKQEPLVLLDRQKWMEKDSSSSGAVLSNKKALKLWHHQWAPVQHLMLTR
jgi:dihydroorotase-like cyclic amidohydrolase